MNPNRQKLITALATNVATSSRVAESIRNACESIDGWLLHKRGQTAKHLCASPPRVLMVDDEGCMLNFMAKLLGDELDALVATSSSAEDALSKTNPNSYDIIIIDLNLPDHSGVWLIEELRFKGVHTPVMIISGQNQLSEEVRRVSGAGAYLLKPIDPAQLANAVIDVLSGYCMFSGSPP